MIGERRGRVNAAVFPGLLRMLTRGGHKLVAVLEAYLDETGIHKGAPYCAVAGFMGLDTEWLRLHECWLAVLRETGGFQCNGFHAIDYFGRKDNLYKSWDRARWERFVCDLVSIAEEVDIWQIGLAIDVEAFLSLNGKKRAYSTGAVIEIDKDGISSLKGDSAPAAAYFLAFQKAIDQGYQNSDGRPVHFVFDRQSKFAPLAGLIFNRIHGVGTPDTLKPWAREESSLTYTASKFVPALQLADLFAYVIQRQLSGMATPLQGRVFERLMKKRKSAIVQGWDREYLNGPLFSVDPDVRQLFDNTSG